MNQRTLARSLAFETLQGEWQGCLSEWSHATADQKAEAFRFIAGVHEEIFGTLTDATDPAERQNLVHLHYLRLKAQWMALNTQIGYQMMTGRTNEPLFIQAALLASLANALFAHVAPDVAAFLDRIVSDPQAEALPQEPPMTGLLPPADQSEVRRLRDELTEVRGHLQRAEAERERLERRERLGKDGDIGDYDPLDDLSSLYQRFAGVENFRLAVCEETGKTTLADVIAYVRALTDTVTASEQQLFWHKQMQGILQQEFGEKTLQEVVFEIRRETVRRSRLEDEVAQARRERDLIARELACGKSDNLLQSARTLHDRIRSLESEVSLFHQDQTILRRATGCATIDAVIGEVRSLRDHVSALREAPSAVPPDPISMRAALALLE